MNKTVAGLTTIGSSFGSAQTVDRLENAIRSKGLTIFSVIDHAAAATDVGLALRPTTLVIFGNARSGTPLMQSLQTVGIDLPLKLLVWEGETGKTWISYNEPSWIAQGHEINGAGPIVPKMSDLLCAITTTATGP